MVRAFVSCLVAAFAWCGVATAQEYRLRPGDVIDVFVLEDPTLNRQALVRPDGRISVPLIGAVQAGGRTPEQVAAAISRSLARDFVQPPSVTVSLVQLAPGLDPEEEAAALGRGAGTIYVLGEVGRPGALEVELPINILEALALSGGPGTFAARDRIQVRREVNGTQRMMLFDYERVEDGDVPLALFELSDGDVIVVPERGLFD
jgi:polysaccharide export outer membrane protein